MTAKEAMSYLQNVPPDEPVFVVRGQDLCALDTIHSWIRLAVQLGAPQSKVDGALAVAYDIRRWPAKKVPD